MGHGSYAKTYCASSEPLLLGITNLHPLPGLDDALIVHIRHTSTYNALLATTGTSTVSVLVAVSMHHQYA